MIRPSYLSSTLALAAVTLAAPAAADTSTVVYECKGGPGFNATFDTAADNVTLELHGGVRLVLDPAVSGSGFRYQGGGYELRGKGPSASLTGPGQPERQCQEIGRVGSQPVQAANPSFNCSGRLNATESRICANPELAELDRKMADVYNWLFTQIPQNRYTELRNDQVQWLGQRNACGSNDDCIRSTVLERTGYLNEYIGPNEPPQTGGASFPFPAQSWGGIVRSGPGQQYARVASLREGEPITILERTDEYFQDRPWFRIQYRGRTGYHWGGIICPKGQAVPGTFQVCN